MNKPLNDKRWQDNSDGWVKTMNESKERKEKQSIYTCNHGDFELCHHYSYDTTHPEWGKCEFKYLPKNGFIKIGLYTQRQQFDQFIFWNWKKPVHILEEGTILDFEITDVIDREFVLKAMKEDQSYDRFNYNKHVLLNESVV